MNIVDQYALTLIEAADTKTETDFNAFFDNFVSVLKKKHHYKSLPAILRAVERLSSNKDAANKTVLVVREAVLAGNYQDIVMQHADIFGTEYDVVEDPQIVGGFMLKNRTNLVDGSYRSRLVKLYKQLTR